MLNQIFSEVNWNAFVPVLTVTLSGIFGLLVAIATWQLSLRREREKFRQDLKLQDFKRIEDLYTNTISQYERSIRYTSAGLDFKELYNEMALNAGKAQLLAEEKVRKQMDVVSDALYEWSSAYNKGAPTKVGDTGLAMVSTEHFKHRDRAKELLTNALDEIVDLTSLMKDHLKKLKSEI